MKIHEYQAKELFRRFGVATPRGIACFTVDEAVAAARTLGKNEWQILVQVLLPTTRRALAAGLALGLAMSGPVYLITQNWRSSFMILALPTLVMAFVFSRTVRDEPSPVTGPFDFVGALLSAVGLALIVLAVLRSAAWGLVRPVDGGDAAVRSDRFRR